MKIIVFVSLLFSISSMAVSFYLWDQLATAKNNISYLENKVDRLDIDALEKIKSKNTDEFDCSSSNSGDWLSSTFCN